MPFLGVQPSRGLVGSSGIDNDSSDSQHYANGSIDTAHIAANQIDSTLTKDAFVGDFTEVTAAAGDSILLGDVSDSGNTKRDTVQGILDLAGGGGLIFIAGVDASTASEVEFKHGTGGVVIDSTYDVYKIEICDVTVSASSVLHMQFSDDAGTSYESGGTDYDYAMYIAYNTGGDGREVSSGASAFKFLSNSISNQMGTTGDSHWTISIGKPSSTTSPKMIHFQGVCADNTPTMHSISGGGLFHGNTNAINAFKLYPHTGTITGSFRLYGVAKS